ncbi:MAG TPA: hypothetical protein VFC24_00965 [Casimicrobiaceae bacterium]|nr:hypothetical protein [Casimicrobiaceae bacterium]
MLDDDTGHAIFDRDVPHLTGEPLDGGTRRGRDGGPFEGIRDVLDLIETVGKRGSGQAQQQGGCR